MTRAYVLGHEDAESTEDAGPFDSPNEARLAKRKRDLNGSVIPEWSVDDDGDLVVYTNEKENIQIHVERDAALTLHPSTESGYRVRSVVDGETVEGSLREYECESVAFCHALSLVVEYTE